MNEYIEDEQLIDRHMAGILEPEEESRLEHLIRTSPEWALRYREAEDMMRLLREGIGPSRAPRSVKDRIHLRIGDAAPKPAGRPRRSRLRLVVAAAAVVVLALGVSLFVPGGDDQLLPAVYAQDAWPLKDLARSADVLLVGTTETSHGVLRLRLEHVLFGELGGGAVALPDGLGPDQRVALFGRHTSDAVIEVVGGLQGVIHLDGIQRWEGRDVPAAETVRLVEGAATFRSMDSALSDLRSFLASDASQLGIADDLRYSAAITARFLGRFDAEATRGDLMSLVMASAKHPEARNAGATALVEADPLGACRALLTRILAGPVERMHAETEDGLVLLGCLNLIQASGRPELAEDLARLAERLACPALVRAARAARQAAVGDGSRTPAPAVEAAPRRLEVEGREGVLLPGCEGRREGFVCVFSDRRDPSAFGLLVALAVDRGWGVLLLPAGVEDVRPWLKQARDVVVDDPVLVVGVGTSARAALEAREALHASWDDVVLIGAEGASQARALDPTDGWHQDPEFLTRVLGH